MDNIQTFDRSAFQQDEELMRQLTTWTPKSFGKHLGIVLISPKTICVSCGKLLVLRKDRHSSITIYHITMGPTPGMHFHKECSSKTCSVTQYYGYYTIDKAGKCQVFYDSNWASNDYFLSSSLTAFSMSLLQQLDYQIVIGQLSYLQVAQIFNQVYTSDKHSASG